MTGVGTRALGINRTVTVDTTEMLIGNIGLTGSLRCGTGRVQGGWTTPLRPTLPIVSSTATADR